MCRPYKEEVVRRDATAWGGEEEEEVDEEERGGTLQRWWDRRHQLSHSHNSVWATFSHLFLCVWLIWRLSLKTFTLTGSSFCSSSAPDWLRKPNVCVCLPQRIQDFLLSAQKSAEAPVGACLHSSLSHPADLLWHAEFYFLFGANRFFKTRPLLLCFRKVSGQHCLRAHHSRVCGCVGCWVDSAGAFWMVVRARRGHRVKNECLEDCKTEGPQTFSSKGRHTENVNVARATCFTAHLFCKLKPVHRCNQRYAARSIFRKD